MTSSVKRLLTVVVLIAMSLSPTSVMASQEEIASDIAEVPEGAVVVPMTYVPTKGAGTQDIVVGNCGSAFLFMFDGGASAIDQDWGFFDLSFPATSYSWSYSVTGPGGFSRSDAGSGLLAFRREWTGTAFYAVGAVGNYSGSASLRATNGVRTCVGGAPDSVFVD